MAARNLAVFPLRTRAHVIADLSVLSFRWLACKAGHVTQVPSDDYGYDMMMFTYKANGEPEPGQIYFQFKATDRIDALTKRDGDSIAYPIKWQHINLWYDSPDPVVLIVYDAKLDIGYWLNFQDYWKQNATVRKPGQREATVYLSKTSVLGSNSIEAIRKHKNVLIDRYRRINKNDG